MKEKIKIFFKRLIALIIILFCFIILSDGLHILANAESFVDITKSILIMSIGGGGMYFAMGDFKEKKWPFEE